MEKLHDDAVPLIIERDKQVGWAFEGRDFTFEALVQNDGTINVYVLWGDDQPGDMTNHEDWADVRKWLETLIRSTT